MTNRKKAVSGERHSSIPPANPIRHQGIDLAKRKTWATKHYLPRNVPAQPEFWINRISEAVIRKKKNGKKKPQTKAKGNSG